MLLGPVLEQKQGTGVMKETQLHMEIQTEDDFRIPRRERLPGGDERQWMWTVSNMAGVGLNEHTKVTFRGRRHKMEPMRPR